MEYKYKADDGRRMALLRERFGLSQGDVANKLKVTQRTVSYWESLYVVPAERVLDFCNILGIPRWRFYKDETEHIKDLDISPTAYELAVLWNNLPEETQEKFIPIVKTLTDLLS